ncbi:hypothetical protein QBC32DRAFT_98334 [Pseudoneurospora amorphoporcata]|uniref:GPI inositol-deacylase n=1 Tax=Pseudoneurospora amorphoporcata TaxID=241081 RepID=A0AAN6SBJ3_9PEZI|nr:hypothetical protein QBC32DRAFT_98334 [Pseudoneurospora amorphoporcata]
MSALRRGTEARRVSDAARNRGDTTRVNNQASVATVSEGISSDDKGNISLRVSRHFSTTWVKRRHTNDDQEGAHGPRGLRLIHSSPEPLVDLIFVHGLKGGSIKTWRKGNDPRSFWPQCWLPLEPGFENANIHTFGYDSDWASSKANVLNVHDFGQRFLEEMRNSPALRGPVNEERPIILVGHSMGGLVIKKAFILSRDIPELHNRIRSIFFLATPHRGSDYAAILNKILTISGVLSPRQYITDLTTGSTTIQLINAEFGKYAHEIPIFSFYEALKTSLGVSSVFIVEKDSAILGYKNERATYLGANHRDICKFDSVEDPNYITVRNALLSATNDLLHDVTTNKRAQAKEQLRQLRTFLGMAEKPDEQFWKVDGSCQWINTRDDFQEWRDGHRAEGHSEHTINEKILAIFWIHANPGTGKSVLASHVSSQLQEFNLECASHYFHVGDTKSRSLGVLLRSIAYQMALSNATIRERLFILFEEGATFDMDDSRTIWTKLYKKCILSARLFTPQYWVIDAIDECSKYKEFFTMLRGERPNFPLRIFITSRHVHDMQRIQRSLEPTASVQCVEIPREASLDDIKLYIQSRVDTLPIDNIDEREELATQILHKSGACFLWVRLVLDKLENVYSNESIMKVLEEIPEGMVPLYERTIQVMAENTLEKHIARAVLLWTVVSTRKLAVSELSQALKLDINTALPSAKSAVEGLCGQLVAIQKDSSLIELIHPTAREFLLSEPAGEFMVSLPGAHERVALTCLQLLTGNDLRPPRNPRFLSQTRPPPPPFLDYAVTQFTEHIYIASASSDKLLMAIDRFFKTNVLSWIEILARKGDLHCIIRASKNLRAYLDRRMKYLSPLNKQVKNIDSWATDLSRLVTQFGEALIQNPSSIHFLLPPLCPLGSAIYQQFGKRPDGLSAVGQRPTAWDDCVAYVSFGDNIAVSVSCGDNLIAVGMESGDVHLYNHRSCQKETVLPHKNPVDLVHFSDRHIAICTTRAIMLQDFDGNIVWEHRLRFRCLTLTSSDNHIMAVSLHGHFLKWDKVTGELVDDYTFEYRNHETAEVEHNRLAARPPLVASVSPEADTIALGYRGGTVSLWDIQSQEFVGFAQDEESRRAAKLLFNPNPNISLLLVIYTNHGLSLYDTWTGSLNNSYNMPDAVGLFSASCTPDGQTLVTADSQGHIHIWDFESLTVLYHVFSPFPSFRLLNFTSDGSSVVDVMDSSMRIWSPAVLVRKNKEEDASTSGDAIQLAVTEGEYEARKNAEITVLRGHPLLPFVYAGMFNGQVLGFGTKAGAPSSPTSLYRHATEAIITEIAVSSDTTMRLIASADVTGLVVIHGLVPSMLKTSQQGPLAEIHTDAQIKQLCFSPRGKHLLISTSSSDLVYQIVEGHCSLVGSLAFQEHERVMWRWFIYPSAHEPMFALFCGGTIQCFNIEHFTDIASGHAPVIKLHYDLGEGIVARGIDEIIVEPSIQMLALQVRHVQKFVTSSTTFLYHLAKDMTLASSPGNGNIITATILDPISSISLSAICAHFLGFTGSGGTTASKGAKSLVFIHRNSWLSSIDLSTILSTSSSSDIADTVEYTQHMYVPKDYLSEGGSETRPVKTSDDDFVFCVHGELIAVKGALKFHDAVSATKSTPRKST